MEAETSLRAIVDAAFVSSGWVIRPAAEATYMKTAVGLVKVGLGITILPATAKDISISTEAGSDVAQMVAANRSSLIR
jgi:hypothetical protein